MTRIRGRLLVGLSLAVIGYGAIYVFCAGSHQAMLRNSQPELAWLKREFNLGDAEFARIVQLHDAYNPKCAEMCRRIDVINAELRDLLEQTNNVTPAMEAKLREAAEVRIECQTMMLRHFYEISRSMPLEQGRRYLVWMHARTSLPAHRMAEEPGESPAHDRSDQ